MQIQTLFSYVKDNLDANKGRLKEIAICSGVPYSTLSKISQGFTADPRISSVQAIADYFTSTNKRAS